MFLYIGYAFQRMFRPTKAPPQPPKSQFTPLQDAEKRRWVVLDSFGVKHSDHNRRDAEDFIDVPSVILEEGVEYEGPNPNDEDIDVAEGTTFKGHKGPVRDILKINKNEFISCDDAG